MERVKQTGKRHSSQARVALPENKVLLSSDIPGDFSPVILEPPEAPGNSHLEAAARRQPHPLSFFPAPQDSYYAREGDASPPPGHRHPIQESAALLA
ncbi:Hypothetical predicted protein [Marmota monax]|uniref:Uncharacterized protein n=1 Tax=Marmota monax TaxID=9995 RepID=A0A5E4BMS3_MARMO|nr:Hypothetical predicted protein [Marmota monax]